MSSQLNTNIKAREQALVVIAERGVDPAPPFPQANGPCFGVSRPLARLLVQDQLPEAWLDRIARTPMAQWSSANGGKVPYRLHQMACFPMGDSVVGYWISEAVRAHAVRLTLVNTPMMVQHHPWITYSRGAFGNSSIVLHPIKNANDTRLWGFAARRSAGPFQPTRRRCRSCSEMGWSTWASREASEWQCCGEEARPSDTLRECQKRSGAWPTGPRFGACIRGQPTDLSHERQPLYSGTIRTSTHHWPASGMRRSHARTWDAQK